MKANDLLKNNSRKLTDIDRIKHKRKKALKNKIPTIKINKIFLINKKEEWKEVKLLQI